MRRSVAVIVASIAPSLATAQVARDTARTAPIIVTATRTPVALNESPASVTVLDGDALRRAGITTVVDALRQAPGLSVAQTGSYGGATSLFIRGGESKFTKVLIDGVPVNDAGGAFDFSSLTTDNLERIEIVRGPASVLYGSDAMAGVVQLFTRRGAGRPTVSASARGGGYSSIDGDVDVHGATSALDYSVGGARHRTAGIQLFNSEFDQNVGSASVGYRVNAFDARVIGRYTDEATHYPTDGSGQVVDSNAVRRDDRMALGVDAGYRISPRADVRLALSSSSMHGNTDDQADSPGDNQGYYYTTGDRSFRRSAEARTSVLLADELSAIVGAQVERQWQTSATTSNYGPSSYTARRRNAGAFAQLQAGAASTLTVGGRYDHSETFGEFFTWRAAGSLAVAADTRVRASYGTSFREPTMLENFGGGFVIGNPSLSPEQAQSADFGIEQSIQGVATLSATLFTNTFTNLIDFKYSATQPNYFNVALTRSTGFELESHVRLPSAFSLDAAFTWLDAKVVDPGTSTAVTAVFSPGAKLLRRPAETVDLGIGYRPARGSFELRFHHVGSREDVYYAPDFSASRVTLPSYVRTDASAEIPLVVQGSRSSALTLRGENLLDARYTEVAGWNYDFARTNDASIRRTGYRAPGRRLLAGLRLTL